MTPSSECHLSLLPLPSETLGSPRGILASSHLPSALAFTHVHHTDLDAWNEFISSTEKHQAGPAPCGAPGLCAHKSLRISGQCVQSMKPRTERLQLHTPQARPASASPWVPRAAGHAQPQVSPQVAVPAASGRTRTDIRSRQAGSVSESS